MLIEDMSTRPMIVWRIVRVAAQFWRFGTLRIVKWLRAMTASPCVLERPFAGLQLYEDVSRYTTQGLLYLEGERYITERFLLAQLVRPGMRIVDVGANVGYYTLLFERLAGPDASIVAIEPSRENVQELRRNVERNGLRNVRIHTIAVGAYSGEATLAESLNGRVVPPGEGTHQVQMRTLDELLPERIDFLKIDVEGYESFVVDGARRVLERDRPILFLEFHPELVPSMPDTFESLRARLSDIYQSIAYYDVPSSTTALRKILSRYADTNECRRLPGPPDAPMHVGRAGGTFWMVCR